MNLNLNKLKTKSLSLIAFVESRWDNSTGLTIGVDFFAKIVALKNKKVQVKLQIWVSFDVIKLKDLINLTIY